MPDMKRASAQPIVTLHPQAAHNMKRSYSEPIFKNIAPAEKSQQAGIDRSSGLAPDVKTALTRAAHGRDTTILVAGYSPTGGGHTARMLDIIEMAAERGTLASGSTVVLHVPEKWERNDNPVARPDELETLANTLRGRGINVVVAEADKSVIGYLTPDGSSDDPRILDRLANMPNRPNAATGTVLDAGLYTGPGSIDWQELRHVSISAKDLMTTIHEIITPEEPVAADGDRPQRRPRLTHPIEYKVKVLTDMDPALQKAASQVGVPDDHRLDQQNHGIMISTDPRHAANNLEPEKAFLAKVLSGMGERVSHIGLGDKNPFKDLHDIALAHGLSRDTTKEDALRMMSQYLMDNGNPIGDPHQNAQVQGVLFHPDLANGNDVRNIVYVYAHNKTNPIASHIVEQLDPEHGNPAYRNTLFVFCGRNALQEGNAMRIATLADADAITTAGAGTVGEFAFLAKHAEAKAEIMLLPIAGHNEQEENARFIERDRQVPSTVVWNTENIGVQLDAFIQRRDQAAPAKYGNGQNNPYSVEPLLSALQRETYVQQAHDLLFPTRRAERQTPAEIIGGSYARSEQAMRNNPVQKLNRKFVKMAMQVLNQLDDALQNHRPLPGRVHFKLNKKDPDERRCSLAEFSTLIHDEGNLTAALRSGLREDENLRIGQIRMGPDNLIGLNGLRNVIRLIEAVPQPTPVQEAQIHNEIEEVKGLLGHEFKTGF